VRDRVDERIIGTVLLVEDNEEVADVTASLLEALGCRIKHARSAAEALDIFMSGGIDLVLSDIVMPGDMNGLDLARTLRERFPGLPILLTTGYSSAALDATREQFPILPKPYRRNQLAEVISHVLAARPQVP
jgi:CheY-like chemotaxis protein